MKTVEPYFFPVRHLSPSGAWHLLQLLDEVAPDIVLVEGPSNVQEELSDLVSQSVVPPVAILAYTEEMPVHTILYPLAEYSPEYQAIKWAKEHDKEVRFIDLPTDVFLAIEVLQDKKRLAKLEKKQEETKANVQVEEEEEEKDQANEVEEETKKGKAESIDKEFDVYETIYKAYDDLDYETFWERNFEHNLEKDTYRLGMLNMGEGLREFTEKADTESAKHVVREGFMKYQIQKALAEGYKPEKMVIVTGAYHTSQLRNEKSLALTEKEINKLPHIESNLTLMPYSYYRLSSRSGYGAGNKSPYYFEMMWQYMQKRQLEKLPEYYMAAIASSMRKSGHIKSSAEVIEAVRLAMGLAKLHGGSMPTLQDLRDGAKTCLGDGEFSKVAEAVVSVEIGTRIGSLPEGMSKTALQNNFNLMLKELKLERYRSIVAETLILDLRENRQVKTEKAAFLDLHRSYFLHQLEVIGVSFAKLQHIKQQDANWKEQWTLCWQVETEIELVESALLGDTVQMAAAYVLKEKLDNCQKIKEATSIMEKIYNCGMSEMVQYAMKTIQNLGVESEAFDELADAAFNLSSILRFGSIRRIDTEVLKPLLTELFLRAALLMVSAANCNMDAAKIMGEAILKLDRISEYHDELVDKVTYINALSQLSMRDDRNPRLSGMACSILLERQLIDKVVLEKEISRRLLPGIPADIGAGWFEGLASRNRYIILANMTIWEKLDDYIMSLDHEELKPAVVCLHRTFSTFAANEKYMVAENLANIWGLDEEDVSEFLNGELSEEEEKMVEDLQDFDFEF